MSKCKVRGCNFYSCQNDMCSLHNKNSSEIGLVKDILYDYFYNNRNIIIDNTQSKELLKMVSHLKKNDSSNLKFIILEYLKINRKKFITVGLANAIMDILCDDLKISHHLVHCIYPFIFDVWNIDDETKWPAVCYYESHDINYINKNKYLNQVVLKKNFIIPKVPSRFSAYKNISHF